MLLGNKNHKFLKNRCLLREENNSLLFFVTNKGKKIRFRMGNASK